MDQDKELAAMKSVLESLSGLPDDEARLRVLDWVTGRLKIPSTVNLARSLPTEVKKGQVIHSSTSQGVGIYDSVADLFAQVDLKTDAQRVLAAAAYLQEKNNLQDFGSREVNQELTHLGHPSTNITRDFNSLMAKKPKLIIQTRKDGKTKQAQKRYRVTTEGIRYLNNLLNGNVEE